VILTTASVSATTIITLVSAGATVVAATATVWAVIYARRTVAEAQEGRAEASAAHEAQMSEMGRAIAAAAEQHRTEMADRNQVAKTEAVGRRVEQLERMSELLLQIVDVARNEHCHPPEPLSEAVGGSQLAAMLKRLQNAVAAFVELGGSYPERTGELARRGFGRGDQAIRLVGEGVDALSEIAMITLGLGGPHAPPSNTASTT
jgi:hypothetical protein